ncbi:type IV pilin protein [Polaromonas jejuensis]|nr:type IV pilin protein [Polaromonas jejuensis]
MSPSLSPSEEQRKQSGFTLIELMIAVAVVGILAAVAYPAYTDSVRKGKRAEARAALMNLLQQQERYLTQMNTYETFAAGTPGTLPFKAYSSSEGAQEKSSHLLGARLCQAVGAVTPTKRDCIEVFAVPQDGIFSDPHVTSMAIDTQGRRTCTGTQVDRCWK